MKLLAILTAVLLTPIAFAHGSKDGKKVAGPNGGRILTKATPHVEFFVTPERKVKLTVLDDANKPVAAGTQSATLITGERSNPVTLKFTKQGDVLVSEQALPAGKVMPAVMTLHAAPDAKAVTEKFNINLEVCSGCKLAEYACTCGHEE